jgi:prepilin-type N-terminal cleavage/methylation domain-containing protein
MVETMSEMPPSIWRTSTRRCARARRAAGFTLVEIMVVVAIVGVISALALASLNQEVQRQRTAVIADEVGAALIEARNLARKRAQCVQVDINATAILMESYATCTGLDIDGLGTPVVTTVTESITRSYGSRIALQDFTGAVAGTTFHFNDKGGLPYTSEVALVVRDTRLNKDIVRYRILPAIGSVKRERL